MQGLGLTRIDFRATMLFTRLNSAPPLFPPHPPPSSTIRIIDTFDDDLEFTAAGGSLHEDLNSPDLEMADINPLLFPPTDLDISRTPLLSHLSISNAIT